MGSLRARWDETVAAIGRRRQSGIESLLELPGRLGGPRAAALAAAARLDEGRVDPARPTVLTLTRPHFHDDIDELRRRRVINFPTISLPFLGFLQSGWASPEMRRQVDFQTTRDAAHARAWATLTEFGERLLERLARRWKLAAILSSNIDYWQAEGIRVAAMRRGIPFLALSRENVITTYDDRIVRGIYANYKFEGDAAAVFSRRMRAVLVDSGCCRPEQVVVTGSPRLDAWRRVARRPGPRDAIVLVSFANPSYYAPLAFRECLRVFLEAARRHAGSGVRFVVKAKSREDRRLLLDIAGGFPVQHAELDHGPLIDVLPRARLVIGFNSMALHEAMFTDAQIALPRWLDSDRHVDELAFDPDDEVSRRAMSIFGDGDALAALIDRAVGGWAPASDAESARLVLVGRFAHLPEGDGAGALVERFILERLRGAAGLAA